jgi:hypothetical protein
LKQFKKNDIFKRGDFLDNKDEYIQRDTKILLKSELTKKIENEYNKIDILNFNQLEKTKTSLQLIDFKNKIINQIKANTLEKEYLGSIFDSVNNKVFKELKNNLKAYYTTTAEGQAIVKARSDFLLQETKQFKQHKTGFSIGDIISTIINIFFKW